MCILVCSFFSNKNILTMTQAYLDSRILIMQFEVNVTQMKRNFKGLRKGNQMTTMCQCMCNLHILN